MAKSKMRPTLPDESKKLQVALYIRVSTERQAEEGYSIEVQTERLLAYTKIFDGIVQTELYVDDGFSGATLERPAIQRLVADVKAGGITHVCVYKLDRLSRSQKDTLFLIEDVFLPNNIAFISIQESFNTATAFGRAVVGILSVFAQLERENIYERTRSGMQKRVEAGYWPGGGGVPFGYDYDTEQGILVPNGDAETVKKLYELYLQGFSLQTIANMLDLKYEKLASQILSRKTNIGIIEYNGVEYRGRHEPIITPEIFERAMMLRRQRSEKRLLPETRHLLSGLVWCGVCGAKMRYQKWGKAGCKLVCYSRQMSKPYLVHDPDCDNGYIWAEDVENAVISDLFSFTPENIEASDAGTPALSVSELLEKKRSDAEVKLRRLYELFAESGNDVLRGSIKELTGEIEALDKKLQEEKERGKWSENAGFVRKKLLSVYDTWPYMDEHEKRNLVCSVIERITVTYSQVRIEYKF